MCLGTVPSAGGRNARVCDQVEQTPHDHGATQFDHAAPLVGWWSKRPMSRARVALGVEQTPQAVEQTPQVVEQTPQVVEQTPHFFSTYQSLQG